MIGKRPLCVKDTTLNKNIWFFLCGGCEQTPYLWLRAPGMTHQRFRGILEARGIEGLLCFGSPDIDQEFPVEFNRCAIVIGDPIKAAR